MSLQRPEIGDIFVDASGCGKEIVVDKLPNGWLVVLAVTAGYLEYIESRPTFWQEYSWELVKAK